MSIQQRYGRKHVGHSFNISEWYARPVLSTAGNVAAPAQATLTRAFGADAIIGRIPTAGV